MEFPTAGTEPAPLGGNAHGIERARGQPRRHRGTRIVTDQLGDLADGAVRFQIERFSITANNATYAEFGDMLDHWGFWPSDDDTFGRVPAMG
ncbi:MAG: hypothetical protein ACJAXA_003117 [Candidatus Aldehydirespiratoraceae bacterium]|jgi:hypothetical protein